MILFFLSITHNYLIIFIFLIRIRFLFKFIFLQVILKVKNFHFINFHNFQIFFKNFIFFKSNQSLIFTTLVLKNHQN